MVCSLQKQIDNGVCLEFFTLELIPNPDGGCLELFIHHSRGNHS